MNKKVLIPVIALAVVAAGAVVYFTVADRSETAGDNLLVPTAAADVYEESNRLEVKEGTVTVMRASGEEEEVTTETMVDVGDTIKVSAEGKATLYWFDHSISRLAGGTELTIDQAAYNPENINEADINFEVVSGEVWSKVQAIVDEDSEFLGYSGNVVAGVRGSVFNLSVLDNEVMVESIAHALTVGEETLIGGEQAGFDRNSGEQTYKEPIPSDVWERPWYRDNLTMDEADQQRMMATMMEKLRNALGVLPGEPGFMDRMEKLDEFMKSDADPDQKKAVKAKIVALVRAMDVLPSDKLYGTKIMLQEKLMEWETSDAQREFLMRKRIERRLFTLYDWIQNNDPSPEELRAYLMQFKDLLGMDNAFFDENPELVALVRMIIEDLEERMPGIMENAEFLRVVSKLDMDDPSFKPSVDRSAPLWNIEPKEDSIRLLDVEPPATTEPTDVIKEEAPFHQGESNV